ncbi:MAG: sensor histidine kinase N-terminal domain-containing protein [Rubrivivax sp.]
MAAAAAVPSLRRLLLGWLLLPLLALVPLAAAVLYLLALRPALDALDRALTDSAVALSLIVVERDGQAALPLAEQTAQALRADAVDQNFFAVAAPDGRLLGGDAALLPLAPPLAAGQWRFFDDRLQGRAVRVAAFGAACGAGSPRVCPIVVAESLGKRRAAEHAVLLAAVLTAAGLALALALLAALAVRRGLRPLREAAREIERRSLDRLDPIDPQAAPAEAASFVRALNGLFTRLRAAAEAQRAFVGDAAHQLRTPLATIRSDAAQALAAADTAERRAILLRLQAAAERGSRVVQQLLTLARSDGAALARTQQRVDLSALAREAAERWLPASLQAGQDLGFDLAAAPLQGEPLLLRELLDNLVDNALQHAGRGARITVRSGVLEGQAFVEVEDDGPGLPEAERSAVWQRFHRGSAAAGPGSGLGLAIVRDIARLHGAQALLLPAATGRGLVARVRFPRLP